MKDRYVVYGYNTPYGVEAFDTEEEAVLAATELIQDSWVSHVSVVHHRIVLELSKP